MTNNGETEKTRLQKVATEAIRDGNTFLIVSAEYQKASSTIGFIPAGHRFVVDDVSEFRSALREISGRQEQAGLRNKGIVVLSGHSIAAAGFYLEHPERKSIEWMTVGHLSYEFNRFAPGVGWVLLNVCFPTSLLESRYRVPERLQGREGVAYHQRAPRGSPVFVAPRCFGSSIFGISALDGGRKPVTEPLIEMLAGRVTTRAFPLKLTQKQALRLVKGDDRLYERLDFRSPDETSFELGSKRQAVSIWSTPAQLEAFRRFTGSAGIRTSRREYLLAAATLERAGLTEEAARLRDIFKSGKGDARLPPDRRISQTRVLEELWAAACSVTPDFEET